MSRLRAVIACPAGQPALAADRRLAEWFGGHGRDVPGWLAEHLENGFPETGEIVEAASPYGETTVFGNESLAGRERLITAEHTIVPAVLLRLACRPLEKLITSRRPRARQIAARLLAYARGGDSAPVYRTVVVVDRSLSTTNMTRNSTE